MFGKKREKEVYRLISVDINRDNKVITYSFENEWTDICSRKTCQRFVPFEHNEHIDIQKINLLLSDEELLKL